MTICQPVSWLRQNDEVVLCLILLLKKNHRNCCKLIGHVFVPIRCFPSQTWHGLNSLQKNHSCPEKRIPGCMCYMSGSVQMENVYAPENEVGMWQWLFGKNVTKTYFLNSGSTDGFVGIAAPSLGKILPIDLAKFGGEILCQPDAFLCSIGDVKVSNTFDQRVRNVVAGVEGFLRQKVSGQGLAFVVGGGSVVQKNLEVGETLSVDISSIIALSSTLNVQIKYNGPMRRAVFGGDNLVSAMVTGPGIVFIQSLPFPRLSQRIARTVTSPNNPKLLMQIVIFCFLAYLVLVSSLLFSDA